MREIQPDPCPLVGQVNEIPQRSHETPDPFQDSAGSERNLIHLPDKPAAVCPGGYRCLAA